jgi:hypothetical protein
MGRRDGDGVPGIGSARCIPRRRAVRDDAERCGEECHRSQDRADEIGTGESPPSRCPAIDVAGKVAMLEWSGRKLTVQRDA